MSHHCHARGCAVACKPEMLMCLRHWRMVPRELQNAVWATYRPGQCDDKRPSEAWHAAADAAIAAVAARDPPRQVSEAELLRQVLLALGSRPECRIFRNSVGQAEDPRTGAHVRFGLAIGASDILGIVKPSGRWLALEVKSASGRVREEQKRFLEMIEAFGGVGRVVRSVEEAEQALQMAVLPRAA